MNKTEAKLFLPRELAKYAALPYGKLVESIDHAEIISGTSESGSIYQIELNVCWDSEPDGDLRIMAAIDDGRWRAFLPLTDSLIMKPDGSLL